MAKVLEINSQKIIKIPPKTPSQRLILEIVFLLPTIIIVGLFGYAARIDVFYTYIITIIFGINLIIRFLLVNERGDWFFYLFGVIAGGGNDLMSTMNHVYNYTSKTIIPILNGLLPIWMILFWGQIFLLFRKIFNIKILKGQDFKKNGEFFNGWVNKQLIIDILILIFLRIVIYKTYMLEFWIPAILYAFAICVRFFIFHPKRYELYIIGILPYAFIFEGLLVLFGLYEYINPIFLGMPLWLFYWWIFLVPIVLKEIFDRLEFLLRAKAANIKI